MANGIYKVTSIIRYIGQAIVNTYWYRSVLEGTFASDLLIDGAAALGRSWINHVWLSALQARMPSDAYLDRVSIMGYNDQYELLYNNTVQVLPTNSEAPGTGAPGQNYLPLANCVNVAFMLKNRLIALPFFPPPKKGLVSFSPVRESMVGNDGTLNDEGKAYWQDVAEAIGGPLPWDFAAIDLPFTGWTPSVGLPGAFVPVRAKTWQFDTPQVLGGITYFKHIEVTDVETAQVRAMLGYRRSRRVEG